MRPPPVLLPHPPPVLVLPSYLGRNLPAEPPKRRRVLPSLPHESHRCLTHQRRPCQAIAALLSLEALQQEEGRTPGQPRPCRICGFVFGHTPDCATPVIRAYYAQM